MPLEDQLPSIQKDFTVKLSHWRDENVPCVNDGKSQYLSIRAMDRAQLRTLVESMDNGIFQGDKCKNCGALAKVSIEESQ